MFAVTPDSNIALFFQHMLLKSPRFCEELEGLLVMLTASAVRCIYVWKISLERALKIWFLSFCFFSFKFVKQLYFQKMLSELVKTVNLL